MSTRIGVVAATLMFSIISLEPLSQAAEPPAQGHGTPTVVVEFAKSPRVGERRAAVFASQRAAGRQMQAQASRSEAEQLYSCPMHPQIRWPKADSCLLCGMTLTPIESPAIVVPPAKMNNGGAMKSDVAPQPMTDHSSMRMSNGSTTSNGSMTKGHGPVNGMSHSMNRMKMNGRGGSAMNDSAMRMGNGAMNGHTAMDQGMIGCPGCTAITGKMNTARHSTMSGMTMNGCTRPASSHSTMEMNQGGMQHRGDMGHMMMGCDTCMEMMRGMGGMTHSTDGMGMPAESGSYAAPRMSPMMGRCGC